jgi:hypothetical protein
MTIFFEGDTNVVIAKDIHLLCNADFDYVVEEDYCPSKYEAWYEIDACVLFEHLKRKIKE